MGTYKFLIVLVLSLIVFFNPCIGLNEVVTNICQQTRDPQFCLDTFKSDPRSNAVRDAHGLAMLALSITDLKIQDTMNTFPEIRKKIKDQVSLHRLDVCQYDYRRAFKGFREAYFQAEKSAYWDAMNTVANATNYVIECQNVYRIGKPIAESPFAATNLKVVSLSGLIYSIISMAAA